MQPYGSPWAPPPPPPARFPWVAVVVVVVVVLLGFGAIAAGAVFLFVERGATAPAATAVWAPTTPTAPPLPAPTATATATTTATPTATLAGIQFVPVAGSPVRGPDDALVTLVEFADFQCPFCKRADTTVASLRVKYGSELRVVWKNQPLPFHPRALPAAEVALEARRERGDAAFWGVHDALFASAPTLDDATLAQIAREHGVRETSALDAIRTNAYQTAIDTDVALARRVGATATPTFFVNGREIMGAQPLAKFETVIDEELAAARARVAKGTPRDHVYDEIMASALK